MTDYPGYEQNDTQSSEYNSLEFMVKQIMSRMSTATVVSVQKVTNAGEIKSPGSLSIQPLVKLQDSKAKVFSHGLIHGIPYWRHQSGNKALIMDPKVGDIGIAVFADRDISSVKANKKESQPGSFRRFDMADGLYLGSLFGASPTSFIQFKDDGTICISPDNGVTLVTVKAGKVTITADSGGTVLAVNPGRIDLGADPAPNAVVTVAGPSPKVFAV